MSASGGIFSGIASAVKNGSFKNGSLASFIGALPSAAASIKLNWFG